MITNVTKIRKFLHFIEDFLTFVIISDVNNFIAITYSWLKLIKSDCNRIIVHYSMNFFFHFFIPFNHHGHMHRIAYDSISYRKSMMIKFLIKSTEFWQYKWSYCNYLWWIKFLRLIIQWEPSNINWCHVFPFALFFILKYFGLCSILKPQTFHT